MCPSSRKSLPRRPDVNQIICLLHILHHHFTFIGMDISEMIPTLDNTHITALSAARILKEFYSVA
ncbi:arginase family protein [Legionella bozemanae]|uniref:arginase family protein n=1 Tax=Legionella bozemanae TaxID=447 RepID=UPI003EEF2DEE